MITPAARPDEWLQNAARLALGALLARLDPEQACRPFFWINYDPPQATHSYWDYNDIAGRYVDGLALARIMTGSQEGGEAEAALRHFLWAQQDPGAGLFYNPDDEAASEKDKYRLNEQAAARPRHVDLFCQRAPMLALTTLLAMGDESARPRLQAQVRGLARIAERHGDELSFPSFRWAPEIRPEWREASGPPAMWQGYRYALLTPLARYVELTGDPEAADLALGLARWYMRHGDVPADGHFRGNTHSGGILPTLAGIARLGLWASDRALVEWVQRAYEWVRLGTPDFGFIVDGFGLDGFFSTTCETCSLADLIHLAVVLSDAGVGDYWDDVARYARNQLLENQYRDAEAIRRLLPGISDSVLAMLIGGFECAAYPNSILTWQGAEGCCIGGGLRALYLAWRANVSETEAETRVNLGFSRSTPHADVVGHEPWAGRIEVRVRTPRAVLIRLPEGVPVAAATALVDGAPVSAAWQGRYARFADLRPGQTAALCYPLPEGTRRYEIAGRVYEAAWRGNTLLEIQPAGERHRTYDRRRLLAGPDPAALPPAEAVPYAPPAIALW